MIALLLGVILIALLVFALMSMRLSRYAAECSLLSACIADMLEKPEDMGRIARSTHDQIMRLRDK